MKYIIIPFLKLLYTTIIFIIILPYYIFLTLLYFIWNLKLPDYKYIHYYYVFLRVYGQEYTGSKTITKYRKSYKIYKSQFHYMLGYNSIDEVSKECPFT